MNFNFKILFFSAFLGVFAFLAGMWWQRQVYLDICLDMGGGLNPGGHPICILEKDIKEHDSKNENLSYRYNCDGKGIVTAKIIDATFASITLSQPQKEDISFNAILSPSGSGAKYSASDSGFVYWEKDGECMILDGETIIFKECRLIQ